MPRYIEHPEEFRDATTRIAAFWRERWLARRLDHAPALEALRKTPAWRLNEIVPVVDIEKREAVELREEYRGAATEMHTARQTLVDLHAAKLDLTRAWGARQTCEKRFWKLDRQARAYKWFSTVEASDS